MIRTLHEYFERAVAHSPQKTALHFQSRRLSYADLDTQTAALARALHCLGLRRQDRLLVSLGNTPETVIVFWAALRTGVCVSVLAPDQGVDKLRFIVGDAEPKAMICTPKLAEPLRQDDGFASGRVQLIVSCSDDTQRSSLPAGSLVLQDLLLAAPNQPHAELPAPLSVDLASIIFTSGSTGDPKGVVMGHDNMVAACDSISRYLELREGDVILVVLPLSFDYGLYQVIMAMAMRATVVIEEKLLNPAAVFRRIDELSCTIVPLVPSLATLLGEFRPRVTASLASVRTVTNTGAALTSKHVDIVKSVFPGSQIFSMYGLTECKRCTYLPPKDIDRKPNSVGIAIPNTEILVVDEHDQRCAPGQPGQLVVRGATVMRGYWRREELTAQRIRPHPLFGDRCLFTGDFGYLDEEGYFHFVGRADETMKIRGHKVAPHDVERLIRTFPGVTDAAIAPLVQPGTEDNAFVAFFCGRAGSEFEASVEAQAHRQLPPHMRPLRVFHMRSLPTTTNGKVDRRRLTRIAEAHMANANQCSADQPASTAIGQVRVEDPSPC